MADRVHRVTMFKLAKVEDQQKLIEQYQILGSTNKKVIMPHVIDNAIISTRN